MKTKFRFLNFCMTFAALLAMAAFCSAQDDAKKAADDTGHATKVAAKDTAHATKVAAKDTGKATETAGKDTGKGVAKGAKAVGHGVKKGAEKVDGKSDSKTTTTDSTKPQN
jgi:hypothetical protein